MRIGSRFDDSPKLTRGNTPAIAEEPAEMTWSAKSKVFRYPCHRQARLTETRNGGLNPQNVAVLLRRQPGAEPEQLEEMRPRETGRLGKIVNVEGARGLAHAGQGLADPEVDRRQAEQGAR